MGRIRNLTLLAVACGLFLSTMSGAVSLDAAEVGISQTQTRAGNPEVTGRTSDSSESAAETATPTETPGTLLGSGVSLPAWILWPLGLVELWLVGWLGVWSVALVGARRFLFDVDSSLRDVSLGRLPFSGGAELTLAHLTFARAFAQHPWVADEWLDRHSQSITDWLSIDFGEVPATDRDILVRVDGHALALADAPTVRAMLPESPFLLALHGDGRKWNDQILNVVLRQSMHEERASRLLQHRTIPVVLDRNCVERFQSKGKPAGALPYWLQVVRNELFRIPGLAVGLDDELLIALVKSRRILPIVDQWSRTPTGLQNELQTAVRAGELPCLIVLDDDDSVAEMKCVIRARSLNSQRFVAQRPTSSSKHVERSQVVSQVVSQVRTPVAPRTFDKSAVPLLVQSLDDSAADVRLAAAQTLGGLGDSGRESVTQLTRLLNDPVTACRQAAVNALGAIGAEAASATASLTEAAVSDHRKVRAAACRALGAIGRSDGDVLNALVEALGDKDAAVRSQAARSLGGLQVGPQNVVMALGNALSDESAEVRTRAINAISAIPEGINKSMAGIVAAVADPVAEVRREVVSALGKVSRSRKAIVKTLTHSLADPDAETRSRAAASLSRFGQESRSAIPQIARLVEDAEVEVRRSAVRALDSIGVPSLESVSALEEATRDADESVRAVATAALERVIPASAAA